MPGIAKFGIPVWFSHIRDARTTIKENPALNQQSIFN